MGIREWIYWLREDFKAWRRGEKRVAPRGTTGRVYAKKAEEVPPPSGGGVNVNLPIKGSATLRMKITRADGSVEYREEPATVEFQPNE